jgi:hypothetical protein
METRVTAEEQIKFATSRGLIVTSRQLARFREQGLMTHPERTEHRGAKGVHTYPASSCLQLERLLTLPAEIRGSARAVSLAMWNHPIEPEVLRQGLTSQIEEVDAGIRSYVGQRGADVDEGLRNTALEIANARPRRVSLPRVRGQSPAARADAFEALLRLFLLGSEAGPPDRASCDELERLMGMDRARVDVIEPLGKPWLEGTPLEGFAAVGSLPALREAVAQASPSELNEAVQFARYFRRLLPLAAVIIGAEWKRPNRGGFGQLQKVHTDPGLPEALWLSFWISIVRSPLRANAIAAAEALQKVSETRELVVELLSRPAEEVARRLDVLSRGKRAALGRMISGYQPLAAEA